MSKGEDITTKYKLDISDFKKGIQESNQQIKLANAQFKAASEAMDDWSKSSDGINAKLKQLGTLLIEQNKKLENYQKQQAEMDKAYVENGKRADELKAKLTELANQGIKKTSEEYKQYQKALSEVEKEQIANKKASDDMKITILNQQGAINKTQKEIRNYEVALQEIQKEENKTSTATGKLTQEIDKQQKELDELKNKYKDIVLQQGKNSDEAKELAKKISDLSEKLKDNKKELDNTSKSADELDKSLDIDTETSTNGFTVMKGALASLVADGIRAVGKALKDFMKESITAYNQFQASTGASTEEMKEFRNEMNELYNNAYGESLNDIGNKMAYIKQVTGETNPTKIKELAENAMALEDTFGSDFNETVRGVTNLMKHFGIDSETAFDLFAKGSQLGLDYTSELGDNIAEYGGNFQQAGYKADEYFQLLVNGSQGGAYNLDKVNDSINEVKNRLGDGTIERNINLFSKETKKSFENWKNGKGTMKDVIDSVVNDINKCTNEQEALNMSATAFGTMGEDANLKVVKSLTTVGDKFKDTKGTMESVKDVRYDDIGTSLTELGRTLKTELLTPIIEKIEPAIKNLCNWVLNNLPIVIPIVTGLATAFGILATALAIQGIINGVAKAMKFLNTTILANPIVLIVALIAGLVTAFIGLWKNCESFRNFWIGLWEKIKAVVSPVIDYIVDRFKLAWNVIKIIWDSVSSYFKLVFDNIKTTFSAIGDIFHGDFSGAWEKIKGIFANVGEWFKEHVLGAIGKIFSNIDQFMTEHFGVAWTNIKIIFSAVGQWFSEKFTKAKDGIVNAFNTVVQFFSDIWNGIALIWSTVANWFNDNVVEPVKNFFRPLVEWFTKLFKSIWDYIASVFKVISELAEGCWNAIVLIWGVVSEWFNEHIVKPLTEFFTSLWNGIKEKAENTWKAIVAVWTVVSNWFNENIITPVKNFFVDLWNSITQKASETWESIKNTFMSVAIWYYNTVIKPVQDFFSGMWNNLKQGASTAWEGIKKVFSKVASFFRDTFQDAWQKVKAVFSTGGKIFDGIKEGIVDAFKNIVNGIIRGINKVVAIPFNAINTALDKIRNVSIAGAQPFSGLVTRISIPEIPQLERGTILKKGQVGLLEGNGAEAVVPLDKNKYWIKKVANELKSQLFGIKDNVLSTNNSITNTNNNNFTQIINAPKQPSRIELYRQTRNLLALKGVK